MTDSLEPGDMAPGTEPPTENGTPTDLYKWHHECAIAEVERLRAFAAHPEQAEKVAYAAGWYQSMCAHCTDPRYAGIKCGVCGRSS